RNDLLGAINWVRLALGLSTELVSPLFQILKGDSDLTSPRRLTPEAQMALQTVLLQISVHWSKQPMLQFLGELTLHP
ncbi:POK19 protein, partial [Lophotis ruficrista]|nr:POK19 protein [Lophotis ruficrista]